jgi:serpin B
LFIDLIKQKATIEVSEEGTEASAITIDMMATSNGCGDDGVPIPEFYANRPFIYLIQESTSGAIFFMGTYQGK